LQSVVVRVSALPPAFVSMNTSLAASIALRTAYAMGVATIPIITSTRSWSMNFAVFCAPTTGSFASSSQTQVTGRPARLPPFCFR
jgi:hypothetical protein